MKSTINARCLRSQLFGDTELVTVLELKTPYPGHQCFMTWLPHCLMQRDVENIVEHSYLNLLVMGSGSWRQCGSSEALSSGGNMVVVNWTYGEKWVGRTVWVESTTWTEGTNSNSKDSLNIALCVTSYTLQENQNGGRKGRVRFSDVRRVLNPAVWSLELTSWFVAAVTCHSMLWFSDYITQLSLCKLDEK